MTTEGELKQIKTAFVMWMNVDLEKKNHHMAARKFGLMSGCLDIAPMLTVEFWYGMGQSCAVAKFFNEALMCYEMVKKMDHTYGDLESRMFNVRQWQGKQGGASVSPTMFKDGSFATKESMADNSSCNP